MSKEEVQTERMTPEEERTYWDSQDPLRQGRKARVQHPEPSEKRLSYFALRLSGTDISRLADIAKGRGMKPSELARAFILQGLEQIDKHSDLEQRVRILEIEVGEVKQKLHHG